jgi:hypothetical protein
MSFMRRLRKTILALPIAATMMLGSCIFDTRDPHPPATGGGTSCTLETSEKAFLCMANALSARRDADYLDSLSENFIFSPTVADSLDQNFAGVPVYDNWTKDVERQVVGVLIGDSSYLKADFGTPAPLINKTTFVRYRVTYALDVVATATPTDTTTYEGVAEIDVRNEGGNWRVTFWNETETVEGSRTWGFLRGIIRLPLVP